MQYTIKLCSVGATTVTSTRNHDQAVSLIATHLLDAAPKGIANRPRYVEALGKFATRQADENEHGYVSLGAGKHKRWAFIDTLIKN